MKASTKTSAALIAAAILILPLALSGCGNKDKEAEKAKAEAAAQEEAIFAVSTIAATKGELRDYLEFGGDVTAKSNIDILPDTAGKIAEVRVRVGDSVTKNQIIAYVDPSRPGMNYELSPVKAPIAGTITAVNVVAGSMVSPQLSVGKVSKMESLEIGMSVPERFVSKIKEGQKAYLRFDAYPSQVFIAKIIEVSPVLDQSSRTMGAKLALIERDDRIKAGMFARIKLITDTKTSTVKIPASAIVSRFGDNFVFVVDGEEKNSVRKQPVTVGIRVDDKAEILSGVKANEEVVVRGQTLLEDGSRINIVSRMESLPEMESNK
ncbi:MAG: efflux RND transporter periplasmic adaptor subunit [Spirochaetales bacterium]|nr:efflux RND transporter periplasmic adaptor subunit [Spirochaetales bacterium]